MFKVLFPDVVIKTINSNKDVFVEFIASSDTIDKENEVVVRDVLEKFADYITQKGVPLFLDHNTKLDYLVGYANDAEVVFDEGRHKLKVVGKVFWETDKGKHLLSVIKSGVPVGVSIGGILKEAEKNGQVNYLKDIELHEISFTMFPANPDGQVISLFAKSLVKDKTSDEEVVTKDQTTKTDTTPATTSELNDKLEKQTDVVSLIVAAQKNLDRVYDYLKNNDAPAPIVGECKDAMNALAVAYKQLTGKEKGENMTEDNVSKSEEEVSKEEAVEKAEATWREWEAPPTSVRHELPRSYFLLPSEEKFPYKEWRGEDKGKINCNALRAAIVRAAQHGYKQVESKARELYNRYCKKESSLDPFVYILDEDILALKKEVEKIKSKIEKSEEPKEETQKNEEVSSDEKVEKSEEPMTVVKSSEEDVEKEDDTSLAKLLRL